MKRILPPDPPKTAEIDDLRRRVQEQLDRMVRRVGDLKRES